MTNHGATLQIRLAEPHDAELVATLIEELNLHQHEPTGHVTPDAVRRDGFGAAPRFHCLLAFVAARPAGYALYFDTDSSFLARPTLFLDPGKMTNEAAAKP